MAENNDTTEVTLQYIRRDLDQIAVDVREMRKDVRQGYVSKEVFESRVGRLEKLVYGMVAVILTSFLMAIMGLVFVV